jgi:hypothetical protein
MSAFLVTAEHIAEIAKIQHELKRSTFYNLSTKKQIVFGPDTNKTPTASDIAIVLANGNFKSLQAKYNDWEFFLPQESYISNPSHFLTKVSQLARNVKPNVNQPSLYNMIRCYEYQSCEDPDYYSSDAYWVLNALQQYLVGKIVADVQYDYEDDNQKVVQWEYRATA